MNRVTKGSRNLLICGVLVVASALPVPCQAPPERDSDVPRGVVHDPPPPGFPGTARSEEPDQHHRP